MNWVGARIRAFDDGTIGTITGVIDEAVFDIKDDDGNEWIGVWGIDFALYTDDEPEYPGN